MIVLDASTAVFSLLDPARDPRAAAARAQLARDSKWAVPPHWLSEALNAVRGPWLGGEITASDAEDANSALLSMPVEEMPLRPLADRIWELRHNLTSYDAAYVALAEKLGVTLVTGDKRINAAGVARCPMIVVTSHASADSD